MDYLCLTPEAGDFKKIGADGDYFTLLKRHIGNLTSNLTPRNLMTMNPRLFLASKALIVLEFLIVVYRFG